MTDSAVHAAPNRAGDKRKLALFYLALIGANIATWAWALLAFANQPALLGASLLAYGLGLRHAIDADHIAAIDNVTRKLMADGQRPHAVGLFFSLGHSTIVVAMTVIVGLTTVLLTTQYEDLAHWGSLIGTATSALFLLFIGMANLIVLFGLFRALRRANSAPPQSSGQNADIDALVHNRGIWGRLFRRFFGLVNKSWHMYPLGLLFGLGFDTATEIGLLSLSAAHAGAGVGLWSILVFPALFTAGMSLLDTTDGLLMIKAYGWAFAEPKRKLYYNLAITIVSIVVALGIGIIQLVNFAHLNWGYEQGPWPLAAWVGAHSTAIGLGMVSLFFFMLIGARALYRQRARAKVEAVLTQPGART